MGKNDWLTGRNTSGSSHGSRGVELTSIISEVDDLAARKKAAVDAMAKQVALYCKQVSQGSINAPNSKNIKDHLNSIIDHANLSDAEARDLLISGFAMFLLN